MCCTRVRPYCNFHAETSIQTIDFFACMCFIFIFFRFFSFNFKIIRYGYSMHTVHKFFNWHLFNREMRMKKKQRNTHSIAFFSIHTTHSHSFFIIVIALFTVKLVKLSIDWSWAGTHNWKKNSWQRIISIGFFSHCLSSWLISSIFFSVCHTNFLNIIFHFR